MDKQAPIVVDQRSIPVLAEKWDLPRLKGHSVQFYEDEDFLLDGLSRFIGSAIGAGDSAIVIATQAHRDALFTQLGQRGINLDQVVNAEQFVSLDAEECLAMFMVGGEPDSSRFYTMMGALIDQLSASPGGKLKRVAAFGEMVALLWAEGNRPAAIKLEKLWNQLAEMHSFHLHCAYPIQLFSDQKDGIYLAEICGEHSTIVPTEQYTTITVEEERLRTILFLQQKAQALESEIERREHIERELEDREVLLRDYLENAIIGMHWVSSTGEILWANKAELLLLGYEREEYIGRHISEFYVDKAVIEDILQRLGQFKELRGYEARLKCKDGSIRDVRVDSNVFARDGKFVHTRCFTTDISEQKQSEQALAHLAAIIESSEDAIISKDLNGIVTSWNHSAERILGYRAEEIVGQPITKIIPPELLNEEKHILATIGSGERIEHFETMRLHKTGRGLNVSLTISPVRNRDGKIVGAAKILRDVTEQKKLEAALHTTERLASVGRLAATIAHEINNPLEAVTNLIYLAGKQPGASEEIKAYLTSADHELRRAAHIAQQTLGFYRSTSHPLWLSVPEVIGAVVNIYKPKFSYKSICIERRIDPELKIYTWSGELKQILSNLISNALDASREGGTLAIRARTVRSGSGEPKVRITIADNGTGISRQDKAEIFRPFFTTKDFVGTGIGLWITKDLIQKRGGCIQVRSRTVDPSGTVMSFCLPVCPSSKSDEYS